MLAKSILTFLALSPTVFGIAFPGPAPTAVGDVFEVNLRGRSPRPTGGPPSLPELFRRQQTDDGVCGYLTGDSEAQVSCTVGDCLYDTSLSWFGCCTGTLRSDCALFTTCVGTAQISSCLSNSACANDDYALACTDATAGVCMTLWGEADSETLNHYVCGSTSTRVQVLATPTDASASGSASATPSPTVLSSGAGGVLRSSSSRQASSSSSSESTSSPRSSRTTATTGSTTGDSPRINSAATAATRAASSTQSTAGAIKTAQAVLGAAGGFAGLIALLV